MAIVVSYSQINNSYIPLMYLHNKSTLYYVETLPVNYLFLLKFGDNNQFRLVLSVLYTFKLKNHDRRVKVVNSYFNVTSLTQASIILLYRR